VYDPRNFENSILIKKNKIYLTITSFVGTNWLMDLKLIVLRFYSFAFLLPENGWGQLSPFSAVSEQLYKGRIF